MNSKNLYTPLRYPGGKGRFSEFMKNIILQNNITNGVYIEPYAGGCGIGLDLLINKYVNKIQINDLDLAIYNFWLAVTKHTEDLNKLIFDKPISLEEREHCKFILNNMNKFHSYEIGYATLFLNRTNRSGILKAGVIGGKDQTGNYKIDSRFHKDKIIKRIELIGTIKNKISVTNEDAIILLKKLKNTKKDKTNILLFLDPPYYVKGQSLYRNFYSHSDHLEIADLIQNNKFQIKWITSYDNSIEIKKMYEYSNYINYELNYSAQKKYVGTEIMFFSQNLQVNKNLIL